MKGIRTATRVAWVSKVLGPGHKFTAKQAKRAFHLREFDGWYSAAGPDGPAQELVVMVHNATTIVDLMRRYRSGERQFSRSELERYLGSALSSLAGPHAHKPGPQWK